MKQNKTQGDFLSHPMPLADYAQAISEINAVVQAEESAGRVNPVCTTRLLTRGKRAERVLLFIHGFTSCPQLFTRLSESFHALGYTVLIPRLPYHGNKDTSTRELASLTAEELFQFSDRWVDIARGLGDQLTVVGLSLGATLVAWLAQNRSDIDLAVPIAPMFRPSFLRFGGGSAFVAVFKHVPDFFVWWDPRTKEKNPAVHPYSYPGFPSRAFIEIVRVGLIAEKQARQREPGTKRIVMVSNASDLAVSNPTIHHVAQMWARHPGVEVTTYEFENKYKLPHDIITPDSPGNRIDIVYPKLIELISNQKDPLPNFRQSVERS